MVTSEQRSISVKLRSYISNIAQRASSRFCAVVAGDGTARHILDGIVLSLPGRDKRLKLAREKCSEIGHRWEVLQIGLTDNCNLLCRHCVRAKRYFGPELSLKSFDFFLGNFNPDCFDRLLLSDWGEIFTINNIVDYLRLARAKDWKQVEVVTNMSLLNEALIDIIMSERLIFHFILSLEAATQDNYEYIRGASLRTFLKNLSLLKKKNSEHNAQASFTFAVCCFRHNLGELPRIMDLAVEYDVKTVLFVHLSPYLNLPAQKDNLIRNLRDAGIPLSDKLCFYAQHLDNEDRNKVIAAFSSVMEKAIRNKIKVFLPENFPELSPLYKKAPPETLAVSGETKSDSAYLCNWPLQWVQVHLNGNVFPCCQMEKKYALGNLYLSPFYKIWRSEHSKRFLDGLRRGASPNPVCQSCNIYRGKNF